MTTSLFLPSYSFSFFFLSFSITFFCPPTNHNTNNIFCWIVDSNQNHGIRVSCTSTVFRDWQPKCPIRVFFPPLELFSWRPTCFCLSAINRSLASSILTIFHLIHECIQQNTQAHSNHNNHTRQTLKTVLLTLVFIKQIHVEKIKSLPLNWLLFSMQSQGLAEEG